MVTAIAADAAIITVGAEGAVIITDGTEAAVTTSGVGKPSLCSLSSPIARAKADSSDANGSRPQGAAGSAGLELGRSEFRRSSAQPHLDGDPDQVRMVLGPEFLLEQGRGVGDGLVGNLQRIGDLDDLVAAAQQPQNFQLARRHL